MTTQKIVPHIWCGGNAEEMGEFYAATFPGATSRVEARYPSEGLPDFQSELAGTAMLVSVAIPDPAAAQPPMQFMLLNGGGEYGPNPSISFMLNFDPLMFGGDEAAARAQLGAIERALSDGGTELMPLGEYPFSKRYGWVQDRFGVSWQLMLTDPAGEPRPFVLPALLFGHTAQNHAGKAVGKYLDTFAALPAGSELGAYVLYDEQHGLAEPGAVKFSDFRLGEQWFVAMDAGGEQDFSFTPGISFSVSCADQAEIDRVWDALSAVPTAEQCGWLVDEFGVSWQVVPEHMGELMQRPNAQQHMLAMKKLIIADF